MSQVPTPDFWEKNLIGSPLVIRSFLGQGAGLGVCGITWCCLTREPTPLGTGGGPHSLRRQGLVVLLTSPLL